MKNAICSESNIFASILTDLFRSCGKTMRELDTETGYSEATIRRWMNNATKIPVDAFYTLVSAMGGSVKEVQARIGGFTIEEYDKTGYASIEQLIEIMTEEREQMRSDFVGQIKKAGEIREAMQNSFAEALKSITDSYAESSALQSRIISDLQTTVDRLRAQLDTETGRNKNIHKSARNAFFGMLSVILLLVGLILFVVIADVPMLGGGN